MMVCNPDMKPFHLMEREEWAINDGIETPSSQDLVNLGGRDRMPKPVRLCLARQHHPKLLW